MDITKLLEADHKEVKKLFKEALSGEEIDHSIVQKICAELMLHTEVEEKLVYPEAEQIEKAEDLVQEAYEEHRQAKELIKKLEGGKLDDVEYKVTLESLQQAIEHHVEEEEGELFPILRNKFSQRELNDIGEKATAMKEQKQKQRGAEPKKK